MTLQSALLRACYIRTLRRHVGPMMTYRVVNAANNAKESN